MGNRSHLLLTNIAEQGSDLVLEANNQLPFFWVLLLDRSTITDNDDLFPVEPDESSPYRSLPLSKDTLLITTARSARYLATFHPELAPEFNTFAEYIIGLSDRGTIEVDLLEITNFTSPREFRDDTLALLQRLDSLQPVGDRDRNEYITDDDPVYLIGFDGYADISPPYSEVSDSYRAAAHRDAAATSAPTPRTAIASPTPTSSDKPGKFPWRKFLSDVIFMGVIGAFFIVAALVAMFFTERSVNWQNALLLLMGIGGIVYAVVHYRGIRSS